MNIRECRVYPPECRNRDTGLMEIPQLYTALLNITGNNRNLSMRVYYRTTSKEFLNQHLEVELDDLGNPTLASLLKIEDIRNMIESEPNKILENLNERHGSGEYSYKDAVERAASFNRGQEYGSRYMAVLKEGSNNENAVFEIVERSREAVRDTKKFIEQRTFEELLLYKAAINGVSVNAMTSVIKSMSGAEGIYSTKAPEKVWNNLYTLIYIDKYLSPEDKKRVFTEEIGHLVVGIASGGEKARSSYDNAIRALHEMIAIDQHSLDSLLDERQKQAKQSIEDVLSSENQTRELLGRMVALYLSRTRKFYPTGNSRTSRALAKMHNKLFDIFNRMARAGQRIAQKICGLYADVRYVGASENARKAEAKLNYLDNNYKNPDLEFFKRLVRFEALKIATYFMNDALDGGAEAAMKTIEELHHETSAEKRYSNTLFRAIRQFKQRMKDTGFSNKRLSNLEDCILKALDAQNAQKEALRIAEEMGETPEVIKNLKSEISYMVISSLMQSILDLYEEMQNKELASVDKKLFKDSLQNFSSRDIADIPDMDKKLRYINRMISLDHMAATALEAFNAFRTDGDINLFEKYRLDALEKDLIEIKKTTWDTVNEYNRLSQQAVFATVNQGSMYVKTSNQMGWGRAIKGLTHKYLDYIDGKVGLTKDCLMWGEYCQKMGGNIDIINQAMANLYDFNKFNANKALLRYSQLLLELEEAMKEKGYTYEYFFEVDENGIRTGNIVLPDYNWGRWENDFYEFREQSYRAIKESHPEWDALSLEEQNRILYEEFSPLYTAWMKENSLDLEEDYTNDLFEIPAFAESFKAQLPFKNYRPGEKYKDNTYNKLEPDLKIFLQKYITIKASLDLFINSYRPGATITYRLPLFRGTLTDRIKRKGYVENEDGTKTIDKRNKIKRLASEKYLETFFQDCLDTDFGDLSDEYDYERGVLKRLESSLDVQLRVPIFGVRKMKDIHNLSTNLTYSTMMYASMALNVRAMRDTSYIMLNGLPLMEGRYVEGNDKIRHVSPRVLNRYNTFLNLNVFNIRNSCLNTFATKGKRFMLSKLVGEANKLGSLILLGGKPFLGFINTLTGFINDVKEGLVGEHYSTGDVVKAVALYVGHVLKSRFSKEGLKRNRSDKMYMFIRYFDATDDSETYFNTFKTHQRYIYRMPFCMWTFSSGNHLIQTLPYIARGLKTTLYKLDKSLFDEDAPKDKYGNIILTEEQKEDSNLFVASGNVWSNFNERNLYRESQREEGDPMLSVIAEPSDATLEQNPDATNIERQKEWGNPYSSDTPFYVKNKDGSFSVWDEASQSMFLNQCRNLTDNLHGLYNKSDRVAMQNHWLFNSILTMKKYMLGYADTMFLTNRYILSERENREGFYITFAKLMLYFGRGLVNGFQRKVGKEESYASAPTEGEMVSMLGMAIPFLGSSAFAAFGMGDSLIIRSLFDCMRMAMYPLFFRTKWYNKEGKNKKVTLEERLKDAGFSLAQIYNLRRFELQYVAVSILGMISRLLSSGLSRHDYEEEEKEEEQEDMEENNFSSTEEYYEYLNNLVDSLDSEEEENSILTKGNKLDAKILGTLFGYNTYEDDLLGLITNQDGSLTKNVKDPGIVYTFVNGLLERQKEDLTPEEREALPFYENMEDILLLLNTFHYLEHRLYVEQMTFAPFMDRLGSEGFTELAAQWATIGNLAPAAFSGLRKFADPFFHIGTNKSYTSKYKYDKVNSFDEANTASLDWDETGIKRKLKLLRTYQYVMFGENLFWNDMINNNLPYYSDMMPKLENGQKARSSYDMFRGAGFK